jgi:hypothetical protein
MAIETPKGSNSNSEMADAFEALAMKQLKNKVENHIAALTNGVSKECSQASHAVVCMAIALSLEMHLAVLSILKVRSRAASIWATIGSVGGGVIVVVALHLLKAMGVDVAGK